MKAFSHLVDGCARSGRRPTRLLLTLSALASAPGLAATEADQEAVREQLSRDWYYTEVVIFQRPEVLDFLSEEALTSDAESGFPPTLRSFAPAADAGPAASDQLWEEDPACLAFPAMDARDLDAAEDETLPTDADGSADDVQTEDDAAASPPEEEAPTISAPVPQPQLAYDPLLDYLNTVAEFEATLEARSLTLLTQDELRLGSDAARIDRDRRFQVLWHGGWLQALPEREAPVPLLIQAGHRWGEVYQLEGTIDVTLGRYLHFHTRLLYHEPLLGETPAELPVPPPDGGTEPLTDPADAGSAEPAVPDAVVQALRPEAPRFMVLEESRRMRSSELHYLDHPKLGVLVRIEPVEVPESLVEAYLALEEGEE